MIRVIFAVLIGSLVWGVFLLGSDSAWELASPEWFGRSQHDLRLAISQNEPFVPSTLIMLLVILRSIVYSVISGYVTAVIANENNRSTLILGFALAVLGLVIHLFFWNLVPLWFNIGILIQFIPFAFFGGKLSTPIPRRPRLKS